MENPRFVPETNDPTLSQSSSGGPNNDLNSPEFEFWVIRNPSLPLPHLLSADELFENGVLLPLHLLPQHSDQPDPDHPNPDLETPNPEPEPESSTVSSTSKRWRDIFKIGEKKTTTKPSNKEKKKERKSSTGASAAAELNINLWPFSRSHSAGNTSNRRKMVSGTTTRNVSSAPCSRSNSAGESMSKRWPSSPGRGGVHLGRSSPVWQIRHGGSCIRNSEHVVRNSEKGVRKDKIRVLDMVSI